MNTGFNVQLGEHNLSEAVEYWKVDRLHGGDDKVSVVLGVRYEFDQSSPHYSPITVLRVGDELQVTLTNSLSDSDRSVVDSLMAITTLEAFLRDLVS